MSTVFRAQTINGHGPHSKEVTAPIVINPHKQCIQIAFSEAPSARKDNAEEIRPWAEGLEADHCIANPLHVILDGRCHLQHKVINDLNIEGRNTSNKVTRHASLHSKHLQIATSISRV